MSNILPYLLTVLEYLGLIAVVCLDLVVCFVMSFLNLAFAFDAPKSEDKAASILGLLLLLVIGSLGLQAAAIWYGIHLGKLWLALVFGVLTIPAYLFMLLLAAVAEGACELLCSRGRQDGLANQGNLDNALNHPILPAMDASIPPTNPPACDALVAEAEQHQKGSVANQQLIQDTLFSAYTAASAKRNAVIPEETMVEPYLSKAPEGGRGRMTWEEIWVFQTQPKTAVRITFTEDGAGGADFAIHV